MAGGPYPTAAETDPTPDNRPGGRHGSTGPGGGPAPGEGGDRPGGGGALSGRPGSRGVGFGPEPAEKRLGDSGSPAGRCPGPRRRRSSPAAGHVGLYWRRLAGAPG